MLRALFDAPEFLAGERVVGVSGLRAQADQLPPAVDHRDMRSGEGLAKIPVGGYLSVRVDVLKVYRSLRQPDCLTGLFVQRDDELMVAAVEVHDQQVAEDDRRRPGAAKMVALDVTALPKYFEALRIDAGRARRSECDVNAPLFDHRRGRGVGVERMGVLRLRHVE